MSVKPTAADSIDGNMVGGPRPTAWFVLPRRHWYYTSGQAREGMINETGYALTGFHGRRLHWRVTTRPTDIRRWSVNEFNKSRGRLGPGWERYLADTIAHVEARFAGRAAGGFSEKLVFFGVELAPPRMVDQFVPYLPKDVAARLATRRLAGLRAEADRVADQVAQPGLWGAPATEQDLEWLFHRSVRLGMPPLVPPGVGGRWTRTDMAEFTEEPTYVTDAYRKTMQIVVDAGSCWVAVGTVGRMDEPNFNDPWLARTDRLDFPVEWHITCDVRPPKKAGKEVERRLNLADSQEEHFADFGKKIPMHMGRATRRALEVADEIDSGSELDRTHTWTWPRCAVASTAGPDEALGRLEQVRRLYNSDGPKLAIKRISATAVREFTPGEELAVGGMYQRDLPARTVAGGMPTASAVVGDESGLYLGYTSGGAGRYPVWFDTHRGMEGRGGRQGGLTVIGGELGTGKSTLLGTLVYGSVLEGTRWCVLDFSDTCRLGALTLIPELADCSTWIDLMHAAPGVLSPYAIIRDPDRDHYPNEADWLTAVEEAEETRRDRMIQTTEMFLPVAFQGQISTGKAIGKAVDLVPAKSSTSPMDVIAALRTIDASYAEHAADIADALARIARQPMGRLIFPSGRADVDFRHRRLDDERLTVMTYRGADIPKTADRSQWTVTQTRTVAVMQLAGAKLREQVWDLDLNIRKGIALDECQTYQDSPIGNAEMISLRKNHRKNNCHVVLASHGLQELRVKNVDLSVNAGFQGATTDPDSRRAALETFSVPRGVGYEDTLEPAPAPGGYRVGEFLFYDGSGCERMTVDAAAYPRAFAALQTTPDPSKVAVPA